MGSTEFNVYTSIISIFPFGLALVIIVQILADVYGKHKIKDNTTRYLLYGIYISAIGCNAVGYSLHFSEDIEKWCTVFGIPACFTVYGAGRACLLGFFVRRARAAQGTNTKFKKLFFDRYGPLYCGVYWLFISIFGTALFSGTPITDPSHTAVSWCLFDSWEWWFIIMTNISDMINSIGSLSLFLYPLITSLNTLKAAHPTPSLSRTPSKSGTTSNSTSINGKKNIIPENDKSLLKFIRTMKWNTFLTGTATISGIVAIIAVATSGPYIWMFCSADPLINAYCAFFMMGSNRFFLMHQLRKLRGIGSNSDAEKNMANLESVVNDSSIGEKDITNLESVTTKESNPAQI